MNNTKMVFKLQMSDIDGIYTRTITSPVRLKEKDYEYRMTFVECSEGKARKLNIGECMFGRSLRDYKTSKCLITRIK